MILLCSWTSPKSPNFRAFVFKGVNKSSYSLKKTISVKNCATSSQKYPVSQRDKRC